MKSQVIYSSKFPSVRDFNIMTANAQTPQERVELAAQDAARALMRHSLTPNEKLAALLRASAIHDQKMMGLKS